MTATTNATCRIGAAALAGGLLLLAGCATAFVAEAPSGRFDLVQVEGRALPYERSEGACRRRIEGGRFELDSIVRRFALELRGHSSCTGAETVRESGAYLRSGGRLTLETDGAARRTFTATETGRSVSLERGGLRFRFLQPRR
jgi:hypothetical protein